MYETVINLYKYKTECDVFQKAKLLKRALSAHSERTQKWGNKRITSTYCCVSFVADLLFSPVPLWSEDLVGACSVTRNPTATIPTQPHYRIAAQCSRPAAPPYRPCKKRYSRRLGGARGHEVAPDKTSCVSAVRLNIQQLLITFGVILLYHFLHGAVADRTTGVRPGLAADKMTRQKNQHLLCPKPLWDIHAFNNLSSEWKRCSDFVELWTQGLS